MVEIPVLVPHEAGVAPIGAVAGLRPVVYDPRGELPPGAADAEVLVPPFQATDDVVALAGKLPRLRLVQLLSAGADRWIGRLPDGVLLSDGRGSHGGATA